MTHNDEPDPAFFFEDALSFEDASDSVRDVGHTIMFGSTGAGKSISLAELLKKYSKNTI